MKTFLEDVIALMEQMMIASNRHIIYLTREVDDDGHELLSSLDLLDLPINLQIDTNLCSMAVEEIEDLRQGVNSAYGIFTKGCGAVCIGWSNPICNTLTAAIAAWALQNTLPTVRVKRTLPTDKFDQAIEEYLGKRNPPASQFGFDTSVFEYSIPVIFERSNQDNLVEWEFSGPEAKALQKFLRQTIGISNSSITAYEAEPTLVLNFNT